MDLKIPSMTEQFVHEYLEKIGEKWKKKGIAIELGCWLGASAYALLKGLKKAGYSNRPMPFYCYDYWKANEDQIPKAEAAGLKLVINQDILPLFLKNVHPVHNAIVPYQGQIEDMLQYYTGYPIEFCIFDAPKCNPTFDITIRKLCKYWIPGVTILGLLDYYFYEKFEIGSVNRERFKTPVYFMERNQENFIKIKEWPGKSSCVFFLYSPKNIKSIKIYL